MNPLRAFLPLHLLVLGLPLAAQVQSVSPIQISIQAKPSTVERGEEVKLEVTLKNVSGGSVTIPLSRPECDNVVEVRDVAGDHPARVDGRSIRSARGLTTRVPCADILSRKYKKLDPGEDTQDSVVLNKIFDLSKAGVYSVTVVRDIDVDHRTPNPSLVRTVSNTIRVTVVGSPAAQ